MIFMGAYSPSPRPSILRLNAFNCFCFLRQAAPASTLSAMLRNTYGPASARFSVSDNELYISPSSVALGRR
jgi:hypothetical protein